MVMILTEHSLWAQQHLWIVSLTLGVGLAAGAIVIAFTTVSKATPGAGGGDRTGTQAVLFLSQYPA